jgi:hypothetical protein
MSIGMLLGFIGDSLTFVGGGILALDAVLEERKLQHVNLSIATVDDLASVKVVLSRQGVQLKTKDDVELSFVRQSVRRAKAALLILTFGFLLLFTACLTEWREQLHKPACPHPDTCAGLSENRK